MALYTFSQVEGLWIQAGGSRVLAPIMAAIGLAESHPPGDPTHADSNATGGVGEKGIWQINPHAWGNLATYNPLGNAKAAVHVEKVQGLTAWTTYNTGAYKHFLGSAKPAPPGGGVGTGPLPPNKPPFTQGPTNAPRGIFAFITGIANDIGTGVSNLNPLEAATDVAQAIGGLALPFVKFAEALDWFFVPSHWIRIFAGLGGIVVGSAGIYELAHTGEDRPAALPAGIALSGAGAVLLFVAFHNLDPKIKTVGELLSDLQAKAQTGAGATVSPQAAVTAANAA